MAESKKKYDIYPMAIPQPSKDSDQVKSIGINRKLDKSWDGSSSHLIKFSNKDETYGRPPEGSLTEERAKKASKHINNEVLTLVSVIRGIGVQDKTNPNIYTVTFGKLFDYYTTISNKVAGILLRARRWNLVEFKGEMLYQGQDDKTEIRLIAGEDVAPTIRKYEPSQVEESKTVTLKEKLKKLNEGAGAHKTTSSLHLN